jgi:hypothetical protein
MYGRIRKQTEKGAAFKASMERPMKIARASSADGSLVTGHEGASLVPPSASGSPGPAGGSPVTGDVGQSLVPESPLRASGSPGPAGGGAAEERCNDEVRQLRLELAEAKLAEAKLAESNKNLHAYGMGLEEEIHDLQRSNDELQGSVDDNKSTILRLRAEIARLKAAELRRNTDSRLQTSGTGSGKGPMQYPCASNGAAASSSLGEERGGASSGPSGEGASSSRGEDVQRGASSSRALATEKPKEHDAAHIEALLKRGVAIMMETDVVRSFFERKKIWPVKEDGNIFSPPLGVSLKGLGLIIVSPMRPPEPGMVEAVGPCEAFRKKGNGKGQLFFRFPHRDGMEPGVPGKGFRCSGCGCHRRHHEVVSAKSVLNTLREAGSPPENCTWVEELIKNQVVYESDSDVKSSEDSELEED